MVLSAVILFVLNFRTSVLNYLRRPSIVKLLIFLRHPVLNFAHIFCFIDAICLFAKTSCIVLSTINSDRENCTVFKLYLPVKYDAIVSI